MSESLSRQLAGFAEPLTYEDLPPQVVDKLKALTLHGLVIATVGAGTPQGRATVELVKAEEAHEGGATILVDGSRATRMGAAFANSKLMHATNQSDSYRMLIHPGPNIIPAALATAELEGGSGREFLAALAAAYEVEARIAGDFIPSTQARGFRSSPVYGVFGAAVATGKLLGLTQDQLVTAIALAATFAGGTSEGPRTDGQEMMFHEPNATRNGVMAGLLARERVRGAETALEGDAGFYNAFTGNNRGELSYAFHDPSAPASPETPGRSYAARVDLSQITEALGERYELLHVTPKIYPTAGYNNPVIELMAQLKASHNIDHQKVEGMTVEMNWLETLYPSPAFPNFDRARPGVGTTHYFAAYTCVKGYYPFVEESGGPRGEDPQVLSLMERVSVVGQRGRRSFAPRITITMKDGTRYQGEYTGDEFKWDLATETRRIRAIFPRLPMPLHQLEELVSTVTRLDSLDKIDSLLRLCVHS